MLGDKKVRSIQEILDRSFVFIISSLEILDTVFLYR